MREWCKVVVPVFHLSSIGAKRNQKSARAGPSAKNKTDGRTTGSTHLRQGGRAMWKNQAHLCFLVVCIYSLSHQIVEVRATGSTGERKISNGVRAVPGGSSGS